MVEKCVISVCTHFPSIHFGSYKCYLWRIYASRMEEVSYRKLLKSPENRQILDWSQRRESRPLWWESIAATAKICVQCLAGSACTGPRGYRHRTRTFRRIHPREFLVILATGLNHSYRICFLIIYEDCFFFTKSTIYYIKKAYFKNLNWMKKGKCMSN